MDFFLTRHPRQVPAASTNSTTSQPRGRCARNWHPQRPPFQDTSIDLHVGVTEMPTNFSHHDHCSPSPRTPVEATSASILTKADRTLPTFSRLPSTHSSPSLHPKDNPAHVNQPEPSVLLLYSKTPNPTTCQRCLSWMPPASRVSSQNSMMA